MRGACGWEALPSRLRQGLFVVKHLPALRLVFLVGETGMPFKLRAECGETLLDGVVEIRGCLVQEFLDREHLLAGEMDCNHDARFGAIAGDGNHRMRCLFVQAHLRAQACEMLVDVFFECRGQHNLVTLDGNLHSSLLWQT